MRRWVVGAVLVWGVWSCNDEPTKPLAGAGLRFVFPEGTDTLEGLRVALLDPDQTYPICGQLSRFSRESMAPQTIGGCDSVHLQVTNLIGEEVKRLLCPVPPETTCGNLFWDGTDAEGNPVPGGYYLYDLGCFQADSVQVLNKGIYVPRGPEDVCDWPLWSEEVSSLPPSGELIFASFPVELDLSAGGDTLDVIRFRNPYVVRVHASGMQVFEQSVTLIEGKYTEIEVTFVPLSDSLGIPKTSRWDHP
jgi:hypothetical protein